MVRNTVDPDLIDDEEDKPKVYIDIDAVTGLILDGIERGEVKADAPVAVLAHTLVDVLYAKCFAGICPAVPTASHGEPRSFAVSSCRA